MGTAANVTAGKPRVAGAIFVAPAGTSLPTDASTALANTYNSLGFVSEDGVVNNRTFDNTDIKEWGGDTVLSVSSNFGDKAKFKLLETLNVDVLKEVFGASNVTGTLATGITVNVKSEQNVPRVWVIDMILRDNALKRIVIPSGTITELGEIKYKNNEATGYDVTISAAKDANGNTHYEHIKAASTSSGGTEGP